MATPQDLDSEGEARRKRIEAMFASTTMVPPQRVPGGYPAELFERRNFEEIGRFLRVGAVELMRRHHGGLPLTFYLFCRRDLFSGEPGDCLYTTGFQPASLSHDSDHMKSVITDLVRGAAALTQARAVGALFEAWVGSHPAGEPRPPGPVASWKEKREVVYVSLELPDGDHIWTGEIRRYGGRGFHIADFVKAPVSKMSGRMAQLMTLDSANFPEGLQIIRDFQKREREHGSSDG